MLIPKILLFVCSFLACGVFTGLLCRWAPRLGLVDEPDERRKMHTRCVPLGGGIAISATMALSIVILALFPSSLREFFKSDILSYAGYVTAALVLVTVGVVDDRVGLRGRVKLAGQIVSALILVGSGMLIRSIALFGWNIDLGLLSVPFTLFWLLGAINALNLLDGIDGMAGTVGLILISAIAVMAGLNGSESVEIVAIAFAGSLLGFLRYNLPPARIFLGDAGSMLIGLVIGSLAIAASLKGPGTVLLAAPLAICAIPILDSFAAVVRRKLTGRSIYTTDRGHLHHCLLDRLGCNRRVLARVALLCGITAAAALISTFVENDSVALVTCLALVGVMIATDTFGRAELLLLLKRARQVSRSMIVSTRNSQFPGSEDGVRLQGSRPWNLLWESLCEAGEKYRWMRIHLDINLPSLHESYSASWRGEDVRNPDEAWLVQMPLRLEAQFAGSLIVRGCRTKKCPCEDMEGLMELLEQLEARIADLVDQSTGDRTSEDADFILVDDGSSFD